MNSFNFDNTYLTLPEKFYSLVRPTVVKKPEFVVLNKALFSMLGIDTENNSEVFDLLSGVSVHTTLSPFAQAYAGHQFGHFTMLGDGRAIILGEHLTSDNNRLDIQMKGAGKTPYARGGDGKATLKAMLREYLMSEAMHHLNIPSSRSLAVFKTGEKVYRESVEEGAALIRVMKSHIRIGTFEYASYYGAPNDLQALLNYTMNRIYPHIQENESPALQLLEAVMQAQIDLVVNWMRVGFIHGVMNTDNVSISGETFDYGPCAFMNTYHPQTVFSSIDVHGRYSFGNQPKIIHWNLVKLAQALLPLIDSNTEKAIQLAQQQINRFETLWDDAFYSAMLDKLGIEIKTKEDRSLVDELLAIMQQQKLDYTNTFAALSSEIETLTETLSGYPSMVPWLEKWKSSILKNPEGLAAAKKLMSSYNPVFIPRNHKVEEALDEACSGNFNSLNVLVNLLRSPYRFQADFLDFMQAPSGEFENNYQTFCGT